MCGIFGVSGDFSVDKLEISRDILLHRGPDDNGLFINKTEKIGLVHTRLSIIETSNLGNQPMISLNNQEYIIIFNGEIYNFQILKEKLQQDGVKFKSNSDTEVLLELYIQEGIEMLLKLNGIFSLAIWDNSKKQLFIARDGLGIKPLYYLNYNNKFIFSSELKAIVNFTEFKKDIDTEALVKYLTFIWCPGVDTPFKNIKKIPPGSAFTVKNGEIIKRWQWYKLPITEKPSKKLDYKLSKKGLLHNLREAVHSQMISDVPLGSFLSGGLDSSAVVALASEVKPNLECYTIENKSSDEGFVDDLYFANKVSKYLNVPLNVVEINSSEMIKNLEFMIYHLDEPIADPAALNVFYICRLAKSQGIKVLLSGSGGDDLLTGYRRHIAVKNDYLLDVIPANLMNKIISFGKKLNFKGHFLRRLEKLMSGASLGYEDRLLNYFRWNSDKTIKSLFTEKFRKEINNYDSMVDLRDFISGIPSERSKLQKILALEQRFFLTDHNLNYTDKMSMATGVEVRVPFLDPRVIDFAEKIPDKYLQKRNQGKWILKKTMETILPKDVIYRRKTGFGAPLRSWIRKDMKDYVEHILSEKSLKRRGIFSHDKVRSLINENSLGIVDASYTIFSLVCIEIWLSRFYS